MIRYVILFLLSVPAHATTYYIGIKGSDDNRGTSPQQAWRSVSKLPSVRLMPGDSVLFQSGGVFTGGIQVSSSGSPNAPIVFSSYDKGPKPVITGFVKPSQWSLVAPGTWEASVAAAGNVVNMVTVDGALKVMGRFPNKTAPEKGYLSYENGDGGGITDRQWTGGLNWTGAEIVIRKNRYVIDRATILNQAGGTFSYKSPSGVTPTNGYGYFIQNDARTLDQPGEWYYNPRSKRFRIYTGSKKPESLVIQVSTVDVLLKMQSQHDVVIQNLSFEGANVNALEIYNGSNVSVLSCNLLFSGAYAVHSNTMRNLRIEQCLVENSNSNGLYIAPYCTNTVIRNNKILKTGLNAGMGKSDHQQLIALVIGGEGQRNLVEYNEINGAGYCGIVAQGDSFIVRRNLINNFCQVTDDGGGIYSSGDFNRRGRRILQNIILNGRGAHEGTSQAEDLAANGIYMDDRTANVEISGNTVAFCSENGLFLHNAHEIDLHDNTVYNNRIQYTIAHDRMEPGDPVTNLRLTRNLFVAGPKQSILRTFNISRDISKFGTIDSNQLIHPGPVPGLMQVNYRTPSNDLQTESPELEGWKSRYGYDRNTRAMHVPAVAAGSTRLEYNATQVTRVVALGGNYTDVSGKKYSGSISLAPYKSIVLMRTK